MKVRQRNIGVLTFGFIFTVIYLFAAARSVILEKNYFSNLSANGYINHAIFIGLAVYIIAAALHGSFIEINEDTVTRCEGYVKKEFSINKITRIYCAHHIFLGPSMFLEYRKKDNVAGKEEKLLVLNQYKQTDKKALLDFLAERFPDIQQDKNCEKIRNGEKVLTTWKA